MRSRCHIGRPIAQLRCAKQIQLVQRLVRQWHELITQGGTIRVASCSFLVQTKGGGTRQHNLHVLRNALIREVFRESGHAASNSNDTHALRHAR